MSGSNSQHVAALQYLREHNVLSLATSVNDVPWVAPVFYAWHAAALYFLSAPHTRHCQNLAANPQIAGSIQEDYNTWTEIKGLQLAGRGVLLAGDEREHAIGIYQRKFNLNADTAPEQILRALDKVSWYRFDLQQLLFVDNSVSFGHRAEIDCTALADA